MSQESELHLVVPGICGPLFETQSLISDPVFSQWISVLSKACRLSSSASEYLVVSEITGLNFKSGFPSAALMMLANNKLDTKKFYMHADPVHLQADMDRAVLSSALDLNINNSESIALCEMLNKHFYQDKLIFLAISNDQWIVESENKINLETTSLIEATGRNINYLLPEGEDSSFWKKNLTEAQMLMYTHDVNDTRESFGSLSINSLWFHGSGEIDLQTISSETNKLTAICSNDDVMAGTAKLIGCSSMKISETVSEYTAYLLSSNKHVNVLHLSDLQHLLNYTDVRLWHSQLDLTLQQWIYPLIKFANKNNMKVTLYPCDGYKYEFSRYDNLKFWRRKISDKYVSCH